jgi:FixJ family two-component response regulator
LLDLNLDGTSALPLAHRLHTMQVPFVVTTGYGSEAMPQSLLEEVMMKPYDFPRLVDAVERMYVQVAQT